MLACLVVHLRYNALVREEETEDAFWESMKNTNVKGERVPEPRDGEEEEPETAEHRRGHQAPAVKPPASGNRKEAGASTEGSRAAAVQGKGSGGRREGDSQSSKPLSKDAPAFTPSSKVSSVQQEQQRPAATSAGAAEAASSSDQSKRKHNSRKFDKHHQKDRSTRKFGGPPPPL